MAKVTSKLQVTLPKRIAEHHGIAPGDEIEFESAGDVIRIVPSKRALKSRLNPDERLRLFDEATARTKQRAKQRPRTDKQTAKRGWKREDLYNRDKPD